MGRAAFAASLLLALGAPGAARASGPWEERVASAKAFAAARAGTVNFAVAGLGGHARGWRARRTAPSASVLKPMLLVAYLRRRAVRDRPLNGAERGMLGPMIRSSANWPVPELIHVVGHTGLDRLAARARMRRFELHYPHWGQSEITALDQVRFFRRIDRLLPRRHRRYGLRLLATIVRAQRWGIPAARPEGWRIYFKGGWSDGTGRVTHQVALLRRGEARISLAVLTRWNPNQAYGERTIRGVARRLLRGL